MKTKFNFIPAYNLMTLAENHGLPIITFYGASGSYILFEGVYYILYDGYHVATKNGARVTYNDNANLPRGFKASIKMFCRVSDDIQIINVRALAS